MLSQKPCTSHVTTLEHATFELALFEYGCSKFDTFEECARQIAVYEFGAPPAPLTMAEIAALVFAGVNMLLLLYLIFGQ